MKRITQLYRNSRGRHGSPRTFTKLLQQGINVGRKHAELPMREAGLKCRVVRVVRRQPRLKRFKAKGENLLRKVGKPTAINQVWMADVTYLKVNSH